jgi:DNA-directed RNA polymerase specialized sigma24 family protein
VRATLRACAATSGDRDAAADVAQEVAIVAMAKVTRLRAPHALGEALALLAGLPPTQRAALTLRYVHDLTDDEIADALGCRPGTVRSLLSRGRAALRAAHGATKELDRCR